MKILTYDDLKPQKGIGYSKVQIWRLEKQNKFPSSRGRARRKIRLTQIIWCPCRAKEKPGPLATETGQGEP